MELLGDIYLSHSKLERERERERGRRRRRRRRKKRRRRRDLLGKLAHSIIEAEKPQDRSSTNWRTGKA